MALGQGMGGSVPNYIGMADSSAQAGVNTAKGMLGALQQGYDFGNKMQDRERMLKARDAFQGAWNSDNPEDIQRVMAQFPEYAAQIQKLIGVRDDQHRKDVGSMAVNLSGLLDSGNIAGAQDFIKQHKTLFDPSGMFSADSVANAIGAAAKDPQKLDMWKNWAQKLTLSTLTPEEATNYGINLQRVNQQGQQIENQFKLGEDRISAQREMSNQRNQLGWANLEQRRQWQSMTPQQRNYEYGMSLPEDQRAAFFKSLPGGGLAQRMDIQQKRLVQSQIKDTIKGPQQKQYYMNMAEKAMTQLEKYKTEGNRAGAAEAYHNVRNALARASMGGNATLNESQIEQATGLPAFLDEKANSLGLKTNGMPSDMFIKSTKQQIKDDLKNERETVLYQGQQFYSSLVAQGMTPDEANNTINGALTGTAIGAQDWSNPKPDNPSVPKTVKFGDLKR